LRRNLRRRARRSLRRKNLLRRSRPRSHPRNLRRRSSRAICVHLRQSADYTPRVTNRVLLILFFAVFVWSLIHPHDYFTWILEVFPAIIGIALVLALRRRFPLTPLVLTLLTLHAIILMVGGHYTYAEVPLGFWMKSAFHFTRN